MERFQEALHDYCRQYSTPVSTVLYHLERETHLKTLAPQMMSGPLQGQYLAMLSKLMQPKQVLEIGTFTGYAAICLAQGLAKAGQLHTIEVNPEILHISRKYIKQAGLEHQIEIHLGDAKDIIPTFDQQFDLVFMDAGKRDYELHYELVLEKTRSGGLILADNVLWSGKVIRPAKDIDTRKLNAFNEKILADPRVENVILPLRDGLLMARKL